MKTSPLTLGMLGVFTVCGAFAQQPAKPTKSAPALPQKEVLHDDFAKAALKALKAIEGDLRIPKLSGSQIYVSRLTKEAIDSADVEARTASEKTIVTLLNDFYQAHLWNNVSRRTLQLQWQAAWYEMGSSRPQGSTAEFYASEKLATDPRILQIQKRERACSSALDDMLRARSAETSPAAKICAEAQVDLPAEKK